MINPALYQSPDIPASVRGDAEGGFMNAPHVYTAIAAVTAELAHSGISKDRRNSQQGYNFRGIDDVYNALSGVLAKHRLCILPRINCREVVERATMKGGVLFYVTVDAEFDFVSAEDGSKHTIRTFGEAMDSADKATNKAMSAAYKYAAFQAFCIPTEGDNDADATTHEVSAAFINDDQAANIAALAEEVGADVPKFCAYLKVKTLSAIPASQYQRAISALEAKRKAA